MNSNSTIKTWAADDRPREKLLSKGIGSLSDTELIALLIGSGTRNLTAVDLAKKLLSLSRNNLEAFSKLNLNQLRQIHGVGNAKALTILAAMELGKRRNCVQTQKPKRIASSRDAFQLMHDRFLELPHEEFHIILVNRANYILEIVRISQGGIHGTVADGKLIFRHAIEAGATGIILCHNHPSGSVHPSTQDKALTRKLSEFGKMVDIDILDHLIFSDNMYFSFSDENQLS